MGRCAFTLQTAAELRCGALCKAARRVRYCLVFVYSLACQSANTIYSISLLTSCIYLCHGYYMSIISMIIQGKFVFVTEGNFNSSWPVLGNVKWRLLDPLFLKK